ncbi:hypothetical protein GCM10027456_19790 [Kineosporia babensis]
MVASGCGCLGLLLLSGERLAAAVVAVAALVIWNIVYALRVFRRPQQRPGQLWLSGDVALTCAVLLSQPWTVPQDGQSDGTGWMLALASMAVVTYQWQSTPRGGAVLAGLVALAHTVGVESSVAGDNELWLLPVIWLLVEAALSRGLYNAVRAGARRADSYLVDGERKRSVAEVSRAQRSDEREHLATLHDTAAATLLMVGQGTVEGRQTWLADQARRDLRVLDPDGRTARTGPVIDLAALLAESTADAEVQVHRTPLQTVLVPPGPATAICDSVHEALANVARHAGVPEAQLSLQHDGRRVQVWITDAGRGFDPQQIPAQRRGISESISARMRRAGGRGEVVSAPGQGTTVHLEWAADD